MIRKFDQEMLAALTRLGFEIEDGGHSAYAECSVLIGDDMDFRIQMVTDNGGRVSFRRVTREQILSTAKAVDPEEDGLRIAPVVALPGFLAQHLGAVWDWGKLRRNGVGLP